MLLLGALGRFLASSWALFKCPWDPLGLILVPRDLPSLHLRGSGDVPGWIFEGFLDFLLNAFMDVVTAHLHSPTLFVYPFWCGGLCAAHPPPPEGMPGVPDIKHWILLCCLPLRPGFRIRLQIPSSKAFPHPYIPSPGPARTAQPSQKLREIPF